MSLAEAERWAHQRSSDDGTSSFVHASTNKADCEGTGVEQLSPSRAYSIALAPHLIYNRSNFLSAVLSSRIYNRLDFQAVGSWFLIDPNQRPVTISRVPSGREDVFQDAALDLKGKRSLMKFMRFVGDYENRPEEWNSDRETPFSEFLEQQFALPTASLRPIRALTMLLSTPTNTPTELALPRVASHLRSIGVFGPGFPAVLPKWGGLAEVAQVACRACAVGGGVYVLQKKIKTRKSRDADQAMSLELDGGEKVSTKWLVESRGSTMEDRSTGVGMERTVTSKIIAIISTPLSSLFPPTSEGGVTPAAAVVVAPSQNEDEPPVHLMVHNSDAGECPMTQSTSALPLDPSCHDDHLQRILIYIA